LLVLEIILEVAGFENINRDLVLASY